MTGRRLVLGRGRGPGRAAFAPSSLLLLGPLPALTGGNLRAREEAVEIAAPPPRLTPPIGGNAPCADTLRTHTLIRRRGGNGGTPDATTVTHTHNTTYTRRGRVGCVEGRVRGCRQRERAAHKNCVRRVRRRKRLSAQLLSEWPTHCEPINSYFHCQRIPPPLQFAPRPLRVQLMLVSKVDARWPTQVRRVAPWRESTVPPRHRSSAKRCGLESSSSFGAASDGARGVDRHLECFVSKLQASIPVKMVFYGSSVTAGIRCKHTKERSVNFPQQVVQLIEHRFPQANVTADVFGYPGASPSFMAACHNTLMRTDAADLYVVEMTDNLADGYEGVGRSAERLLGAIRQRAPSAALMLLAPIPQRCVRSLKRMKPFQHVPLDDDSTRGLLARDCYSNHSVAASFEDVGAAHNISTVSARHLVGEQLGATLRARDASSASCTMTRSTRAEVATGNWRSPLSLPSVSSSAHVDSSSGSGEQGNCGRLAMGCADHLHSRANLRPATSSHRALPTQRRAHA